MTTKIADDYLYIKARMEEIAKERAEPIADVPEEPKQIQHQTYMGWDIYAPVNITSA